MVLRGKFYFSGALCRPGFKDPSKLTYMAQFVDGVDSLRVFISEKQYHELELVPAFTRMDVDFDYNPATNRLGLSNFYYEGGESK